MKKFLVSVLAIAGLVACHNEEAVRMPEHNQAIAFDTFVENATRAADHTITEATLGAFDVWAWMDEKDGTMLSEERVTENNGCWTYQNVQYWTPGHLFHFVAVAPVKPNNWTYNYANDTIAFTNVDGTEDLLLDYVTVDTENDDFNTTYEAVGLQFAHLLSKVKCTFVNGYRTENVNVIVENVKITTAKEAVYTIVSDDEGVWSVATGEVELQLGNVARTAATKSNATENARFTIPNTEATYKVEFDVTVLNGEQKAIDALHKTTEITGVVLEQGKSYNFVAEISPETLNLQAIEFNVIGVDEWEENDQDTGVYVGETVGVATADELAAAIADHEVTAVVLTEDIDLGTSVITRAEGDAAVTIAKKNFTIDGDGKTLTYSGSNRVIDFTKAADVVKNATIKDLTIKITSSYCERGINFNNANGALVIDNVKFEGTAPTYAVNFPGSADGVYAIIKNSRLVGNIALNVWGENMAIDVVDSEFVSVDNTTVEGYSAVKLNNDGSTSAEGTVINIEGGKIIAKDENGEPSHATANATATGKINISETTEVVGAIFKQVAIIDYGTTQVYGMDSLQDAVDKVAKDKNGKIRVTADFQIEESVLVPQGATVEIDLNGHTITGTDDTTKDYGLIKNNGVLTINDSVGTGKLVVSATTDSGTNRYSAVISNEPGAKLVINGGTLEHLGGTYMAYGIDNLTNGNLGNVECTINGGTIKSTYRAVRQFLNSDSCLNALVINGGILEGVNQSLFFHDASKKANKGKLVVNGGQLKGGVYLFVTAESPEWPVEVSIASAALTEGSKVTYKNVPVGYAVMEENGVWKVLSDGYMMVSNAEQLSTALNNEDIKTIVLTAGEFGTIVAKSNKTIIGLPEAKVECVNLNGANNLTLKSINFDGGAVKYGHNGNGEKQTYACAYIITGDDVNKPIIGATNLVIDGCTFSGKFANGGAAIAFTDQKRSSGGSGNVTIKNCTFNTEGAYYEIYSYYTGNGINGYGDFVIENNVFKSKCIAGPIYLSKYASSTPVVIKDNTFETVSSADYAWYVQDHSSYGVSVAAENNTFAN